MSVSYSLTIGVIKKENTTSFSVDIIKSFLEFGWTLYSQNNEIIYTDVGDEDNYDFCARNISVDEYFEIVEAKEQNGEIIAAGMFLFEEKCSYRIDLLITPDFKIIISPDDATQKVIDDIDILDVNWYLGKTLPALKDRDIFVESISFVQI